MLEFWGMTISGLYKHFLISVFTKGQIKESFKMHNRFPLGIDNIISELIRRGHLIPLENIKNKSYYQQKQDKVSWLKWLINKAYNFSINWVFKREVPIPENIPLVSVSYLYVFLD